MNIKQIDEEIGRLSKLKSDKRKRSTLKCAFCKKRTQINKLTYLQPYTMVNEGHNCNAYDSQDMHWKCVKCEKYNRECENNDYSCNDYEKVKDLRFSFGEHVEVYGETGTNVDSKVYKLAREDWCEQPRIRREDVE